MAKYGEVGPILSENGGNCMKLPWVKPCLLAIECEDCHSGLLRIGDGGMDHMNKNWDD